MDKQTLAREYLKHCGALDGEIMQHDIDKVLNMCEWVLSLKEKWELESKEKCIKVTEHCISDERKKWDSNLTDFIKEERLRAKGIIQHCLHADVGYPICPHCSSKLTQIQQQIMGESDEPK